MCNVRCHHLLILHGMTALMACGHTLLIAQPEGKESLGGLTRKSVPHRALSTYMASSYLRHTHACTCQMGCSQQLCCYLEGEGAQVEYWLASQVHKQPKMLIPFDVIASYGLRCVCVQPMQLALSIECAQHLEWGMSACVCACIPCVSSHARQHSATCACAYAAGPPVAAERCMGILVGRCGS